MIAVQRLYMPLQSLQTPRMLKIIHIILNIYNLNIDLRLYTLTMVGRDARKKEENVGDRDKRRRKEKEKDISTRIAEGNPDAPYKNQIAVPVSEKNYFCLCVFDAL